MYHMIILAGLMTSNLYAVEQYSLFHSTRALGRGGAYVAAFDSDEATRLNPATLADSPITYQFRGWEVDGFVSQNVINTIGDIISSVNSSDGFGFIDKLEKKFGERHYGKTQWGIFSQRFGAFEIAFFANGETHLELHNPILPEFSGRFDSVVGANISYAFTLLQSIKLGITLRPLYRYYLDGDIGFIDIMDFIPQDSKASADDYIQLVSGFGLGVDLGMIWSPTKEFRIGFLAQNIGDSEYFQDYGTEPPPIQQKLSTGLLYRLEPFSTWYWDFLIDIQGLVNRYGLNLLRLTHLGTEFGTSFFGYDNDIGFTMGINEGYVGGGLFFDLWICRLQYVNYTVELGHSPGQVQDQRIAFSFNLKLTF